MESSFSHSMTDGRINGWNVFRFFRNSTHMQHFFIRGFTGKRSLRNERTSKYKISNQTDMFLTQKKAAKENLRLTFFSHGNSDEPNAISMSKSLLRESLKPASGLGMQIAGFDDLP